jgi:hypothetical protein
MNNIIQEVLLVVMIIIAITGVVMMSDGPVKGSTSCDVAEISPDFTHAMREQCRQLREAK